MRESDILVSEFSERIRNTETYKKYQEQCRELQPYPELRRQINRYREDTYALQNSEGDIFDKIDEYDREYSDFRSNPLVENYLQAELKMVRMLQRIYGSIAEMTNLDLDEE